MSGPDMRADADAFYDAAVGKLREKGAPLFDRDAKYIEE